MAYQTPKETQNKWIEAIKACGQSLIDNAETIAGNYELQTGVYITIPLKPHELVEISIDTTYIPKDRFDPDKGVGL